MNHEQRNAFIEKEFEENIMAICKTKGKEYSNSTEDANANFHKLGKELGMDPKQILWVYAQKHNQAISNFLKEGVSHSNETIEGRIHDAILYHFILLSLLAEESANDCECKDEECCKSCSEGGECEKHCDREPEFQAGDVVRIVKWHNSEGCPSDEHDGKVVVLEESYDERYDWDTNNGPYIRFADGDIIELVK